MQKHKIIITDGWHPTINPSSRMPIHHHRYVELLGNTEGILNELPRPYGGNTLRAMQINSDGTLTVKDLNKALRYMPWWIPSNSQEAIDLLSDIVYTAIANENCIESFSYKRMLNEYILRITANPAETLGEALNGVNSDLYREVYPQLPELHMVSITKSSFLPILAEGFLHIANKLTNILNSICNQTGKKEFGLLGFITDYQNQSWRVLYQPSNLAYTLITNNKPHASKIVDINFLVNYFIDGKLIPGSMLLAIIELSLVNIGYDVIHYGNAYGHHDMVAKASGLLNYVHTWDDNADSWNYAYIIDQNGVQYPIHLLDLMKYGKIVAPVIKDIIEESLKEGCPIIIHTKAGGDLLDALFNRRT